MNPRFTRFGLLATLLLLSATLALATEPPGQIHYQGVLRDVANHPQSGTFDMVLRLWDAATAGNEILIDSHTGAGGVAVSGGQFIVDLGGGAISDGFSPGIYTALADVFRDFGTVYLEVTVGADTLTPRTRIVAAAYALNVADLAGLTASNFLDTSSTAETKSSRLTVDDGSNTAGYGLVAQSAGTAAITGSLKTKSGVGSLGYGDIGVWGQGKYAGGFCQSRTGSGSILLGYGDAGVQGDGRSMGGMFTQTDYNGLAEVGQDGLGGSFYGSGQGAAFTAYHDYGIQARGVSPSAGARFYDPGHTGTALLASGATGIFASGTYEGGEFYDADGPGDGRVAMGGIGVHGFGSYAADPYYGAGGYFADVSGPGQAWLGWGNYGADGYGDIGGYFENYSLTNGTYPTAYVASGPTGISANGYYIGAQHQGHTGSSGYSNIAWTPYHEPVGGGNYTVFGFEPKAFVQNHPADPNKSVVYVAIEGDEAGTYTRGQAHLAGGVARVPLNPAFALVTNPDLGLTASLTPLHATVPLSIASLSSNELVVRGPEGADGIAFDYAVFGLRIGFENHRSVQDRAVEGAPHLAGDYPDAARPETNQALARWKGIRTSLGDTRPLDLSRAEELVALARRPGTASPGGAPALGGGALRPTPVIDVRPQATIPVAVADAVRAGDLMATDPIDPARPFVLATAAAGQTAVGIAATDATDTADAAGGVPEAAAAASGARTAPMALAGSVVVCHVDATAQPIAAGDLLVASPLSGHAMRAPEHPAAGTVVARALEALSGGTGTIQVRVISQ